jgi:exodeoxyribonuclease-1
MKNIAIIDIESNGASTSYANIISIAGILVSPELEELDRFEFWCRNKPGHVPDPYSMWVNRGFTKMKNSNLSHYSMMTELHKYINKWSPCLWTGWNSIGFDFIMLQKENYRSLFPIYVTNQKGNEHSDFLPVARASKLFYPDSIKTNISEKSNPIFRLDSIGPLNFPNLDKKKLHTAIGDCETCLEVMRKLKKNANPIFESAKNTTAKISAKNQIEKNKIFTTVFYFYGKARPYLVTYLCDHGKFTWPMVFCLENDPKDLMKLDYKSLKESLKKPGKWVRALPLKHPMVLESSYGLKLDLYKELGLKKINERADLVKNNKEFAKNASLALAEIAEEKQNKKRSTTKELLSYEDSLYAGGFPSPKDQNIMKEFQEVNDWSKKYKIISKIEDSRFIYFGKRLIYQNDPKALPAKEYEKIHSDVAKKLLSTEETKFTTIPMAEKLIDDIRAEKDISKEKIDYMDDIDIYISEMRATYEKAL